VKDISILIGGKAGFGIDKSSLVIASILNQLGYSIYVYRDYPSLIRGGHTFSIIRASDGSIASHKDKIDILLALNQDTVNLHKARLSGGSVVVYDSDSIKPETVDGPWKAMPVPLAGIVKAEGGQEIMRNVCIIGAMAKAAGVSWQIAEGVLRRHFPKEIDVNLKIAERGYTASQEAFKIDQLNNPPRSLLSGNEALALGLINGGLDAYLAYPMTPSSPILHSLAGLAGEFGLKVIHPESEISVMLMALGFSYAGKKVAVGTSGGGFCLMTEGLSFSGMAELPVVVIMGQRPGPSTGLPTYSSQADLHFVLNAGQGEFPRFLVAPGDAEEAYYWAGVSLNIASKFQVPAIILSDKNMGEGTYVFDLAKAAGNFREESPAEWDGKGEYKRYLNTSGGVSLLAFPPDKDAVIKVNSYEHDEMGITTEDPEATVKMQDKRLRKETLIKDELKRYETVKIYGNKRSETVLLCWGSNKGVCEEVAKKLNVKAVQVVVLSPFPVEKLKDALAGANKIIAVESNATAQLVRLINSFGSGVHGKVLKYDGRPFSVEELTKKIEGLMR